jgi:hypothetical protein
VLVTVLVLTTGMAYSLFWVPVFHHHQAWVFSGDLWAAYRSAHYIGWGALGNVYAAGTGLVTFPGILLLLTPLAMVTGHFGLTESFPYYVPHPTAWLALGPYSILIGCSALFALDALAEHLGVDRRRRMVLCLAEGVVLWPVLVTWGHPEDALALALAAYATVFALEGRFTGAGWLLGAAVATQPLVLLVLPVLLARGGKSVAPGLVLRSLLPAVLLLAAPVAFQFHATVHALVDQPNYPGIDHRTPWTSLAPRLGGAGKNLAVAGGPGRIVAVVAACALGLWARRWRGRDDMVVWALAGAVALRCLTESVMDPFYLWPAIAVALVVAARARPRRLAAALGLALTVTVVAELHLPGWSLWWGAVTGGLVALLAVAVPPRASRVRPPVPIPVEAAGQGPVPASHPVLSGAIQ